jgi:hypothetical protein
MMRVTPWAGKVGEDGDERRLLPLLMDDIEIKNDSMSTRERIINWYRELPVDFRNMEKQIEELHRDVCELRCLAYIQCSFNTFSKGYSPPLQHPFLKKNNIVSAVVCTHDIHYNTCLTMHITAHPHSLLSITAFIVPCWLRMWLNAIYSDLLHSCF